MITTSGIILRFRLVTGILRWPTSSLLTLNSVLSVILKGAQLFQLRLKATYHLPSPSRLSIFSFENLVSLHLPTDIFIIYQQETTFYSLPEEDYANETLLQYGFLGCSPLQPMVAFLVQTLAAYQQAHGTCLQFSIEVQCKMLCHLHNMGSSPEFPYQSTWCQPGTIHSLSLHTIFKYFWCLSWHLSLSRSTGQW